LKIPLIGVGHVMAQRAEHGTGKFDQPPPTKKRAAFRPATNPLAACR
jgi:hypothetical protein